MDQQDLTSLKEWFAAYCASFSTSIEKDQRNFASKQAHTQEVCLNAVRIAHELGLSCPDILLAEAMALFHDVGRFPQYRQYRTFDDSISVNHAAAGAKVLLEQNVLRGLAMDEQDLIIRSVTLHNVFTLPAGLDDRTLLFAKLVRDADKIDILRVLIHYLQQDPGERAEAVALGLPDLPGYSPEVLDCLSRGEMAKKGALTTVNDFKLLQLAWVYDLNFTSAIRMFEERGYIGSMAKLLPRDDAIAKGVAIVQEYVQRKLKGETML